MAIRKIHHVAYRCHDAAQTVAWYKKHLNMEFQLAFAEDYVPSTHAYDPYMHIFLDAGGGNVLAFFELPQQDRMGRYEKTPAWVQHIAFEVENREELVEAKARLEQEGIEVVGITDHSLFHSIYFFDPNGHRLELAWNDPAAAEAQRKLREIRWEMLEEWDRTRQAPKLGQFAHGKELEQTKDAGAQA